MASIPRRRVHLADDSEVSLNQITSTPATRETRFSRSQVRMSMDTPVSERTFHPSLLGSRQPSVGGSLLVSYDGFLFLDGQGHYTAPDNQEHAKVLYAELAKCLDVLRRYAGMPEAAHLDHKRIDAGEFSEEVDLKDEEGDDLFGGAENGRLEHADGEWGDSQKRRRGEGVPSASAGGALSKMTVNQLRQHLQAAGLSGTGNKAMLQDRLAKFFEKQHQEQQQEDQLGPLAERYDGVTPQRQSSRRSGPLPRSPPTVTSSSLHWPRPPLLSSLALDGGREPVVSTRSRPSSSQEVATRTDSSRIVHTPHDDGDPIEAVAVDPVRAPSHPQGEEEGDEGHQGRDSSSHTWWGSRPNTEELLRPTYLHSPPPRCTHVEPYSCSTTIYQPHRLSMPGEQTYSTMVTHIPWATTIHNPYVQGEEGEGLADLTPRASAVSRASTALLSNRSSQQRGSQGSQGVEDGMRESGERYDGATVKQREEERGERESESEEEHDPETRATPFTQRRSSGGQTDLSYRRSGTPDGTQETVRSSLFDSPPSRSQNSASSGGLWGTLLNAGTRLFKSVAPGTPANSERKRRRDSA